MLHVFFVHEEDREVGERSHMHNTKNDTPHCIVYYADRRILFLNPGVLVLDDDDVRDPHAFAAKLFAEHGMQLAPMHNTTRVRKLMLKCLVKERELTGYNRLHLLPPAWG